MPQVVIDFTPSATEGIWSLALRVPPGIGSKDVHKAFLLLAHQIAERHMPDVRRTQQHLEAIRDALALAGQELPTHEESLITVPPYGTYGELH